MNLPDFTVRTSLLHNPDGGYDLSVKFDFYKEDFHPYMQMQDFSLMQEAMCSDERFKLFEGTIQSPSTNHEIKAIANNRLAWLRNCGFLSTMNDKWMFSSRNYCGAIGIEYKRVYDNEEIYE